MKQRLVQWLGLILLLAALPGRPAAAGALGLPPVLPGICSEADRFGVWAARRPIDSYNVAQLHAGWYRFWAVDAHPSRPAGMWFAQVVRVSDDGPFGDAACSACPTWQEVRAIAEQNPGSLWIIGNEPDRQDWCPAERYAAIYHDFYTFLKAADPTCLVAIGGVVQPTPIRLQYLDQVLSAYRAQYGTALPVDVWNTHNYVLREAAEGWGCGIPPGTDPALAIDYGLQDHDNPTYWASHLLGLRAWMAARGYQDRPLIISEFGILMWDVYGYTPQRVRAFMLATFDWLRQASDPASGFPRDGNRLVQAWNWYSLDDNHYQDPGYNSWNHLFDPDTLAITDLGLAFRAYTAPLGSPYPGSVDLEPVGLRHSPPQVGNGGLLTTSVSVDVYNAGDTTSPPARVRFRRDGQPAGEATVPPLGSGQTGSTSVLWTNLVPGQHQVDLAVDPDAELVECDRWNNGWSGSIWVGAVRLYLPLVVSSR